jgi:hypothetical protein
MQFKFKDLMIHVLPEDASPAAAIPHCINCTLRYPCSNYPCSGPAECSGNPPSKYECTVMNPCTANCTPPASCLNHSRGLMLESITEPQHLAILKAQLKQALADVERHERVLEEVMRPQTLQEAEQLEEKLKSALDELQKVKQGLK